MEELPKPRNFVDFAAERGVSPEQAQYYWTHRGDPEAIRLIDEHLAEVDARSKAMGERALAVPDAPFKTTWPDLAVKRAIRHAAENDYDAVSWTPGAAQAARYPDALRQKVNNINWEPHPDGNRYVVAEGQDRATFVVNKDGVITDSSANQARGKAIEGCAHRGVVIRRHDQRPDRQGIWCAPVGCSMVGRGVVG